MDDLKEKIISMVGVANGVLPYKDLLNSIDQIERQHLRRTLVAMKSNKLIAQVVAWDAKTNSLSHTIQLFRE